jgi:hypothetical protein
MKLGHEKILKSFCIGIESTGQVLQAGRTGGSGDAQGVSHRILCTGWKNGEFAVELYTGRSTSERLNGSLEKQVRFRMSRYLLFRVVATSEEVFIDTAVEKVPSEIYHRLIIQTK